MTVQKLVMDDIIENYATGDYDIIIKDSEEEYEKAAVVNKILKEKSKHQP